MRYLVWLALLLASGVAFAHSYLIRSNPRLGQLVRVMPKTVTLEFSEPLEINFSSFKVYALPASSDPQKAAAELSAKVLPLKNDAATRADLGLVSNASPAAQLELKLKEKLPSGWYVVMYRVLSIDGHITTGQFAFKYQ
jgi:copper resistance protein C